MLIKVPHFIIAIYIIFFLILFFLFFLYSNFLIACFYVSAGKSSTLEYATRVTPKYGFETKNSTSISPDHIGYTQFLTNFLRT